MQVNYNLCIVPTSLLQSLCSEVADLGDLSLEEYIEKVKNNQGKYIQNIIGIQGVLNSNDLYYITNLTDTNF